MRGDLTRGRTLSVRLTVEDSSRLQRVAVAKGETDSEFVRRTLLNAIVEAEQMHETTKKRRTR